MAGRALDPIASNSATAPLRFGIYNGAAPIGPAHASRFPSRDRQHDRLGGRTIRRISVSDDPTFESTGSIRRRTSGSRADLGPSLRTAGFPVRRTFGAAWRPASGGLADHGKIQETDDRNGAACVRMPCHRIRGEYDTCAGLLRTSRDFGIKGRWRSPANGSYRRRGFPIGRLAARHLGTRCVRRNHAARQRS